jgi:nitrite reductase/ring-hydroxylating ferredoxin subunit
MWKKIGLTVLLITLLPVAACTTQQQAEQSTPQAKTEAGSAPSQETTAAQETGPLPEEQPVIQPVSKPSGPIKAVWIEPQVEGDTITIPLSDLEQNWNIHFKVDDFNFMAYLLDDEVYVRANVCPPCRSIGFSLNDDILVCDRCATIFEAETGAGIEGACVDYPKASVRYELSGRTLRIQKNDLTAAYEATLQPG